MKLFLAPIQGMTTACYRNAFAKYFGGIDAYYAPFIATADINKVTNSVLKDILPESNESRIKLVPQLLSNSGVDFQSFATRIVELGYKEINWNIGCPYPMVTNKKKGSGILQYPDMIKSFLEVACSEASYEITVKMRLGMSDPEEGMRVIEILNEYPLGGVIIHARTGLQMYEGSVDLTSFDALKKACKHEITYNGDIFTYSDFINISSRFPSIQNYMLGRGALRDPFLPHLIKGNANFPENKEAIFRNFHGEIFNYYKGILSGDKHLCDKMKEFWVYLSFHIDKSGKFMKKIKKSRTASEYLEAVQQLFSAGNFKDS